MADTFEPSGLTRGDLMTCKEVAVLLGVPTSTVLHWARTGVLPRVKLGKHVRFIRATSRERSSTLRQGLNPMRTTMTTTASRRSLSRDPMPTDDEHPDGSDETGEPDEQTERERQRAERQELLDELTRMSQELEGGYH